MPSQKELAKKLKLSQATVSRALNNDSSLPLATKLKIKQLADEAGYEPRRYTGRKHVDPDDEKCNRLLALVYHGPTLDGKYYSLLLEMIQGFIQASAAQNVKLIVKEVENMDAAKSIVAKFCNNVLGVVALLRYPDEIINLFCSNFRCVSLNHHYENVKIQVVEPAQGTAFFNLYRYLYTNGHRRIGFLTVRDSYLFAHARYAGYLQGAYFLNTPFRMEWVMNIMPDRQLDLPEIAERVARLYREEQVTAYLCTSGNFAKKLMDELERLGVRVPDDISLAAFDDILTPTSNGHLLCGMQANYEHIARMSLMMLRNSAAFTEAVTVCCDTEFHRGNTVSDRRTKQNV